MQELLRLGKICQQLPSTQLSIIFCGFQGNFLAVS